MHSERAFHRLRTALLPVIVAAVLWTPTAWAQAPTTSELISTARDLLARGQSEQVLALLHNQQNIAQDHQQRLEILRLSADAEQARGTYGRAILHLKAALNLADSLSLPAQRASVLTQLGDLTLLLGRTTAALELLDSAVAVADSVADDTQGARARLNRATVLSRLARNELATHDLERSEALARSANDWATAAKAILNRLKMRTTDLQHDARLTALGQVLELGKQIENDSDRMTVLTALGIMARPTADTAPALRANLRTIAVTAFTDSGRLAKRIGNERARSESLGHLGALYEVDARYEEAATLTQSALFLAQASRAKTLEYQWQWQLGRILRAQGKSTRAIANFQAAVNQLDKLKSQLAVGHRLASQSFQTTLAPLYFGLADLLLTEAKSHPAGASRQARLRAARQAIEQLKAAELEDYFNDGCVTALQSRITPLEDVDSHTAVLYHIALADRLEILISSGGEMNVVTVPVSAAQLNADMQEMRTQLQRTSVRAGFLPSAMRLYAHMIAPVEQQLTARGVDTLVFVPYGNFLLLPPSALFDGKKFLIEKFAVAITPGLNLTDPKPMRRQGVEVLLAGLSEQRPGFSALPQVANELALIQSRFAGRTLMNDTFTSQAIHTELQAKPYTVLHFATHAQFSADPAQTFLLTYDGRLSMDQLDQLVRQGEFRDQPVELLTLSACETAAGDYRSALGLAGVGIKAGARSALASLWPVTDKAAVALVAAFYELLDERPELSKARALQMAQRRLLDKRAYRHPAFWSAFVLIRKSL